MVSSKMKIPERMIQKCISQLYQIKSIRIMEEKIYLKECVIGTLTSKRIKW